MAQTACDPHVMGWSLVSATVGPGAAAGCPGIAADCPAAAAGCPALYGALACPVGPHAAGWFPADAMRAPGRAAQSCPGACPVLMVPHQALKENCLAQ